jgi:Cu+-exporting ATPase
MAKDPVCGMDVDEIKAAGTALRKGKMYYFCALSCKDKFVKDPDTYINRSSSSDCDCCG